jgi:hypothetical protein
MTGATSGVGPAYTSGALEFIITLTLPASITTLDTQKVQKDKQRSTKGQTTIYKIYT